MVAEKSVLRALQSHVKKFGLIGRQANLDVAQRLAPSQLRKSHHAKQAGAAQSANTRIAAVAFDDAAKGLPRQHLRAPPIQMRLPGSRLKVRRRIFSLSSSGSATCQFGLCGDRLGLK